MAEREDGPLEPVTPILLPSLKGVPEVITWSLLRTGFHRSRWKRVKFPSSAASLCCRIRAAERYGVQPRPPSYLCQKSRILPNWPQGAGTSHRLLLACLCCSPLAPDQQSRWPFGSSSNRWSSFQFCFSLALAISPAGYGLRPLHGFLLRFRCYLIREFFPDSDSITLALLT